MSGPSIITSLDVRQSGADVVFVFRITNNAKRKLELVFPSGHTHDLVIVDSAGEEIWRWSAGRMFTQALQNRVLAAYDSLAIEVTWKAPVENSGSTFTAVATLLSENHPLEQRTEFALK